MEPSKRARSGSEDGSQVEVAKIEFLNESMSGYAAPPTDNNLSSPAKPKPVTIRLETTLADAYVRTRHNNLRCFPKCSPFHMEQRFCGRALEISLEGVPGEKVGKALVFGEFRNKRSSNLLEVGYPCGKDRLSDLGERIMFAELVRRSGDQDRFVIQPPRKWHYPGKLRSVDWHVIQLYVVIAEVVQATFVSSAFHVVPIWKSDDKNERDVEVMVSNPIAPLAEAKAKEQESDSSSSASSSSSSSSSSNGCDKLEDKSNHTPARQKQQKQRRGKRTPDSSTRESAAPKFVPGKTAANAPKPTSSPQVPICGSPQLALPSPFQNAMPTGGLNVSTNVDGNNNNIRGGVELSPPLPTLSFVPTQFLGVGHGGTPQVAYPNIFVPAQMMNGQQVSFIRNMMHASTNGPQGAFAPVVHLNQVGYTFQMPPPAGNLSSTNQFGFRPSPTTSPSMAFAFPQAYPQQQHQQQQQQMTEFVVTGNGVPLNNNSDQSKVNQAALQGGLPGFRYYHPSA